MSSVILFLGFSMICYRIVNILVRLILRKIPKIIEDIILRLCLKWMKKLNQGGAWQLKENIVARMPTQYFETSDWML